MMYAGTYTFSEAYTTEVTQVKTVGEWALVNAGTPKNYGVIRAEPDVVIGTGEVLGWTIYMFDGFNWRNVGFKPALRMDPTGLGGGMITVQPGGSE